MLDSNTFNPEKITIVDFRIVKGQIEASENFDIHNIAGYLTETSLQFSFNLAEKLIKVDFNIEIQTQSQKEQIQAVKGAFHFIFVYHIENLDELAKLNSEKIVELQPNLANAIASITYSTVRGVLLVRLQGTALQNFILPIVNPNNLLKPKKF